MSLKTGFFEEVPGQKSMTRLLAFILLIALIIFVPAYFYFGTFNGGSVVNAVTLLFIGLVLVWLIAIFAPKYLQKILELAAQVKGVKIPGMDALNATEITKVVETNKSVETSKEINQ